jgi:branched-chain amino acid transport system permease protein
MNPLQTAITALSVGSLYALAALGIGLLFGVLRLINFAQGAFITIGAFALLVPSSDATATMFIGAWPSVPRILAIVAIVAVLALLSELAVFRRLRDASPATLMIASFAVGYILQNLVIMVYGSRPKAAGLWPGLMDEINITPSLAVPQLSLLVVAITGILLIALVLFLKYTNAGLHMRAAADDFRMARLLGVSANRVIALAFALSGGLAGIASLILVVQTGVMDFDLGVPLMLFAFIATVIGGMGSLFGAVVGGYVVGILTVVFQALLPPDYRGFRDAFVFLLVILLLLVRPNGLVLSKAAKQRV